MCFNPGCLSKKPLINNIAEEICRKTVTRQIFNFVVYSNVIVV